MLDFTTPWKLLPTIILLALPFSADTIAGPVEEKLTGELADVLAQAGPDELVPVTIVLGDQLS